MYTFEEKTFFFVEGKSLNFVFVFFCFQIVVKHSYVKFVLTTRKLYVASVFPLLFFCVAKYESCAVSCTAFTFPFPPVVHSSHYLVD